MTLESSSCADPDAHELGAVILQNFAGRAGLDGLVKLADVDDESLYTVGHHLYSQARYADAMPVFRYLVARHSLERRYLLALASSLQMLGRHAAALTNYLLASALEPNDPANLLHICECLISGGRLAEAREGLAMAQEICEPLRHDGIRQKVQGLLVLIDRRSEPPTPGRKNDICH